MEQAHQILHLDRNKCSICCSSCLRSPCEVGVLHTAVAILDRSSPGRYVDTLETFYKGSHTGVDHQETSSASHGNGQSEVSKFREQNNPQDDEVADHYQLYCITPRLPQKSKQRPIDWWKEESQQEAYPDLSRWAIDILSIPAMSDEPERLFSRAGNTLDKGRVQLLPETVQALECIKSWTLQKVGNEDIIEYRQLDEEGM